MHAYLELEQLWKLRFNSTVSEHVWKEYYEKWGGIPRSVLEKTSPNDQKKLDLRSSYQTKIQWFWFRSVHEVDRNKSAGLCCIWMYCLRANTKTSKSGLLRTMWRKNPLNTSWSRDTSEGKVEAIAHRILAGGGNLRFVFYLSFLPGTILVPGEVRRLGDPTEDFHKWKSAFSTRFRARLAPVSHLTFGRSGLAWKTALPTQLTQFMSAEGQVFNAVFQMTAAKTHTIKVKGHTQYVWRKESSILLRCARG